MARQKKEGVKVNLLLDKTVNDKLVQFCETTARTKTKVVELAIMKYIEDHKEEMK